MSDTGGEPAKQPMTEAETATSFQMMHATHHLVTAFELAGARPGSLLSGLVMGVAIWLSRSMAQRTDTTVEKVMALWQRSTCGKEIETVLRHSFETARAERQAEEAKDERAADSE